MGWRFACKAAIKQISSEKLLDEMITEALVFGDKNPRIL
jgi:hypothetical protein